MGDGSLISRMLVAAGIGLLVASAAVLLGLWAALAVGGVGAVLFGLFMIDVAESE